MEIVHALAKDKENHSNEGGEESWHTVYINWNLVCEANAARNILVLQFPQNALF